MEQYKNQYTIELLDSCKTLMIILWGSFKKYVDFCQKKNS